MGHAVLGGVRGAGPATAVYVQHGDTPRGGVEPDIYIYYILYIYRHVFGGIFYCILFSTARFN